MRHKPLVVICAIVLLALSSVPAFAQRHGRGGHGRVAVINHSPLLWGGGFYSGFYHPYYSGFGAWGPWYPYPGFGFPAVQDPVVSVRLQISPRDAQVFVDGYAAGVVDDYDGVFQRLRLIPGPHEIVVYYPGHRTLRQRVYYNPGSTHTIRFTLEQLAPGEAQEAQPIPHQMPAGAAAAPPSFPGAPPADMSRAGTLALRVQPADAAVFVDGEQWKGPLTQDRLVVQLSEGSHRIRVEKRGFQTFAVDIDVRAGETTSFNVSLLDSQ